MEMLKINYLAILVGVVANTIFGFLWYGPIFGKMWMKLNNFTEEEMKGINPGPLYAKSFLATVVTYVVLAMLINAMASMGAMGMMEGAKAGFMVWLGFVTTVQFTVYLFSKKSIQSYYLDTAYQLVTFLAAGAILGAWR